MRSRQDIERDLAAARSQLTAAEAGDRTDRAAFIAACQAATREVQRFEQELANFRPDPLAGLVSPPVRPVAPVATPPPANPGGGGPTPRTTPAVVAVPVITTVATPPPAGPAMVGTPATTAAIPPPAVRPTPPPPPPTGNSVNWWALIAGLLAGLLLLVWAFQLFPPGRQQANTGRVVSPPSAITRTPVRTPPPVNPTAQPTYRDCMFEFGERRELADGRCDHLPQ